MTKAVFIIDGSKFSSAKGFYNYIEKYFTEGLSWKIGRNLDAFNDILRGGFGKHDYDENIIVKWRNLAKSRTRLNTNFLKSLIEILENHEQVEFQREEH